jgi:uncharacterized damage-inducible protein DinB
MREIERIVNQMERAFAGDAWYSSSLQAILTGVTAEQAAARPIANAHSIWEIILHVAAWQGAVRGRLEGESVKIPEEGDWPKVTDTSETAWQSALELLRARHRALLETVLRVSDARLDDLISSERNAETGGGVSFYITLHGIIQHDVYHSGQIALLKKAFQ